MYPGTTEAYFVTVRGMPDFRENDPLEHAGLTFVISSFEGYNDKSTVLRRFIGVTARVVRPT